MNNRETFKNAAIKILKEAGKPLNYREITKIAIINNMINTSGLTPQNTMNAILTQDIMLNGDNSIFYKGEPGYFGIRDKLYIETNNLPVESLDDEDVNNINDYINSKQKGDIGESRVTELLTLYSKESLSCYRPVADDEGIDIIVKRKFSLDTAYLQVKSSFGPSNGRGFVSTVKDKNILNKSRMLFVFIYFDINKGDLYDFIFLIPAPDFIKLTSNNDNKNNQRTFTVSLNNPEKSKYSEYIIEKRELADKVLEYLDKV